MRIGIIIAAVLACAGCSKYEFQNPTGAKAVVIYDKTGTSDQVTKQIAAKSAAK